MKIDKFVLIGFDVVRAFYNQSGTIRRHLLCALHKRPLQFIRSPESSRHIIHENHGRFFRLAHSEKFAQGMRYPFPKATEFGTYFCFLTGFVNPDIVLIVCCKVLRRQTFYVDVRQAVLFIIVAYPMYRIPTLDRPTANNPHTV